jgi:transcription elongation factor Elf1
MKTLNCEVCEESKPVSELKSGRYCGLIVCDSCRANSDAGAEPNEEEWSPVAEKK